VIVVVDSSGLIAAFNSEDPEHRAVAYALNAAGLVIISPLALVEIDHVVAARASRHVADRILHQIQARIHSARAELAVVAEETLAAALAVRMRYGELKLDIADTVNIAIAAEHQTNVILSLDRRDFRAVRPLTGHTAFRLLPDDF